MVQVWREFDNTLSVELPNGAVGNFDNISQACDWARWFGLSEAVGFQYGVLLAREAEERRVRSELVNVYRSVSRQVYAS